MVSASSFLDMMVTVGVNLLSAFGPAGKREEIVTQVLTNLEAFMVDIQ